MTNQVERVARAWDILVKRAKQHRTIGYKELADAIGLSHHRPVRFILSDIQEFCRNHLPPLTILVVNKSGRPGAGFNALAADRFDEGVQEVYDFDWLSLDNPFGFASDGTRYDALLNRLLAEPDNTEEIYRRVKVRGAGQLIFRDVLLKAYGRHCCFSDFGIAEGLEAVHIVPWANCGKQDRLNVRNGLLLSSLHHRLFDAGLLTLTPDYRIVFCPAKRGRTQPGDFERSVTTALHLRPMRLPRNPAHFPSPEFITVHNQMLQLEKFLPTSSES